MCVYETKPQMCEKKSQTKKIVIMKKKKRRFELHQSNAQIDLINTNNSSAKDKHAEKVDHAG